MQFFFELVTVQNHELNIDAKGIYAQIRQPRIQSDDDEFKLKIKFKLWIG